LQIYEQPIGFANFFYLALSGLFILGLFDLVEFGGVVYDRGDMGEVVNDSVDVFFDGILRLARRLVGRFNEFHDFGDIRLIVAGGLYP